MPGTLTYAAIALMARDRLRQIRDALRAKQTNGLRFTDIEKQILYLAEKAYDRTSLTQPAIESPLRLYGPPFGDQVSQFFLLGTAGPEIPAYAALFTPGQRWLRDTLHKGSPDQHREQVLAGSTDFALAFWRQVEPLVRQDENALKEMQAYVLGHLCHVAADVVASPFVDDVEWHLGSTASGRRQLTREQVVGAIEVQVSAQVFRRGTATRSESWGDWWPHTRKVPAAFFQAYKETLEAIYGPGARRPGFGAFDEQRTAQPPQELSADLLRDGYTTFRTVVQRTVAWDIGDWMLATFPMFLPALAALPVAAALPNAKDLFRDVPPPGLDRAAGTYETIVFPFAITAIVPLAYTFGLTFGTLGGSPELIFGWASAGVQAIASVLFFTTLGGAGAERYVPIFVLPLIGEIVHIVFTLTQSGEGLQQRVLLALSSIFHLGLSAVFALLYWAVLHLAVEALNDQGAGSGIFWGFFAVWFLILGLLWVLSSILLRSLTDYRLPADDAANVFATGRSHHLRLFDDTTLFHGPRPAGMPAGQPHPTLAHRHFPSGRRKLLKLWWEGPGQPTLLAQRDLLVFTFGGTSRTVHAPVAPTRPSEYAAFLERTVKDGDGNAKLKAKAAYAGDLDYELPPGWVFADHGDDQTTEEAHATEAARAKPLGNSEASAYDLYHALKAHQAVRFDKSGPTLENEERPPADRRVDTPGVGTVQAVRLEPNLLEGLGTNFTTFLRPGDIIRLQPPAVPGNPHPALQERMVLEVLSNTRLRISQMLEAPLRASEDFSGAPPPAPPAATFVRLGEEPADLVGFLAKPDDTLESGETVMNHAADLATLLCLGATSHLLDRGERDRSRMGNTASDLNPVYQVFRNWNLDRRRVNEWKMLVLGGAVSEKPPGAPDPALPSGAPAPLAAGGEATANQLGWLPLLRSWLDMASRPGMDAAAGVAFRPGNPTNLELSRALAFLLDMGNPA
jgi:hypothetical protein